MKKIKHIALFLCFMPMAVKSQVNPEILNVWENPYYINPSNIRFGYDAYFTLNTRAQWVKFPGAPVTALLSVVAPVEKIRSQFGFKSFVDRIGYTSTIDFALSYSYSARLNKKNLLNFGVSASIQTRTYDFSKITADDMLDPTIYSEKVNGIYEWNANVGLEYTYNNQLFIGLSSQNLLSYFPKLREGRIDPIQSPTNYLFAKYATDYMSGSTFYMDFGACLRQYNQIFVGDFMLSTYYDFNSKYGLQFQLFGGTAGDIGFTFGVNLISDLKLLCSYNYNYAIVNKNSLGSFEIMLTYGIKKCPTCFNEW